MSIIIILTATIMILSLILILPFFLYFIVLKLVHITYIEKIFCIWGWHSQTYKEILIGQRTLAECKWCGFRGRVDSTGHLYKESRHND